MPDNSHGPPKEDRPPENGKPIDSLSSHHATPTSNDDTAIARQLRVRRAASQRLPVLDSRRADPWHYEPPGVRGYEAAARHLLGHSLTPAPNRAALEVMRRCGGENRQLAAFIAERYRDADDYELCGGGR
jgi:hypothetical protein